MQVLIGIDMSKNCYITLRQQEKDAIHAAKERDPRFADGNRISDGAYVSLALGEYIDNLTDSEGDE